MNIKLSEYLQSMELDCYLFDLYRERMGKCHGLLFTHLTHLPTYPKEKNLA